MFEIRLDRLVDKWSGSIEVGVTTHNPGDFSKFVHLREKKNVNRKSSLNDSLLISFSDRYARCVLDSGDHLSLKYFVIFIIFFCCRSTRLPGHHDQPEERNYHDVRMRDPHERERNEVRPSCSVFLIVYIFNLLFGT